MTLLYTDPIFLEHDTGPHAETAERLRAIERRLETAGLFERMTRGQFEPLTEAQLAVVHDADVAARVQYLAESGGGNLDSDTVVSATSFRVGLAAAGACVTAVDAVITGPDRTAFCLVRPPGHHASRSQSMGFCLFNNIALAAQHGRTKHHLDRVLIVDFDVHHGNGTQDVFYRDPAVHFLSVHRYGDGFYPGTGAGSETGSGPGLGATSNVPIRYGISRDKYREEFTRALERAAAECRPQLVLLSAGFDAHRLDPIGNLGLESEDYAFLTERVLDVAKKHAGGRLVSCLEGGYHWAATAESVQAHLTALVNARL